MENRVARMLAAALFAIVLLLSACGKQTTEESGESGKSMSDGVSSTAEPSERTKRLYPSVELVREQSGAAATLVTKPAGYPEEIGNALGMLMSLHEKSPSYLYHVAFCRGDAGAASTRESISQLLQKPDALHAEEWVEIASVYPQESPGLQQRAQGWYYFLFTAEEIRTLAGAGIQCRLVGSGEGLSEEDEEENLSLQQAIEHMCQWTGDSFRAKASG